MVQLPSALHIDQSLPGAVPSGKPPSVLRIDASVGGAKISLVDKLGVVVGLQCWRARSAELLAAFDFGISRQRLEELVHLGGRFRQLNLEPGMEVGCFVGGVVRLGVFDQFIDCFWRKGAVEGKGLELPVSPDLWGWKCFEDKGFDKRGTSG